MRKTKKAIAAALFLAAVLALSGCGSASQDAGADQNASDQNSGNTISIGYLPITHALPVFEAKELAEQGEGEVQVELVKFSSWPDLMDALNSGKINGASVLTELAMSAKSKGIDLKAAALGHKDGNVIIAAEDIKQPSDLKNKTIAIPSKQSSHYILIRDALKEGGLTIDDVKIVELAPPEMPSSLSEGSIQAYCVAEPFGAAAVTKNLGHVLYESDELWEDSVCCALVFNGTYLNENKETADKFLEEYFEAGEKLNADVAETIAEEYLGQDANVLEQSLKWISYDNLEITEEEYDDLVKKVVDYGVNENPPTYKEFVYKP